jgi:hypothetical protein
MWFGPDGEQRRGRISQDYYVQVRYPLGRWVAITVAKTRRLASSAAGAAYRGLLETRGQGARQCRVVSVAQLIREGGPGAVAIADAEIARRGEPPETS